MVDMRCEAGVTLRDLGEPIDRPYDLFAHVRSDSGADVIDCRGGTRGERGTVKRIESVYDEHHGRYPPGDFAIEFADGSVTTVHGKHDNTHKCCETGLIFVTRAGGEPPRECPVCGATPDDD